ncbi:MAG: hypothetical protein JSU86_01890 [Phycisphaerales bacterium]|nr:MAG: hypothetical protein JSU86_01890 [Phycisphaerales bacterium]
MARTRTATLSSKYKHDCAKCKHNTAFAPRTTSEVALTGDMPPHAKLGECYALVYVPPEFDTVTERVCVREESHMIEIIPAKYDWVEERVLVKEASTQLVEVPAQFDVQDHLVQTSPGHATWIKANKARCVADTPGLPPQDIFCLVGQPPTTLTIQSERLLKGPMVKEVTVPAEYQTIRKQKLIRPASTRKVTIPPEFREVKKTVMVCPGRMEWQRVDCDSGARAMNREVHRVGAWANRPSTRTIR